MDRNLLTPVCAERVFEEYSGVYCGGGARLASSTAAVKDDWSSHLAFQSAAFAIPTRTRFSTTLYHELKRGFVSLA